jgi:hypothetical protein
MSASTDKNAKLVLGGPPRVDLLPPEIKANKGAASTRRRLLVGVAAVVVLSVAAYSVAAYNAFEATNRLRAAEAESADLRNAQTEFAEARALEAKLASITAATALGTSTEIDWEPFIDELRDLLPQGAYLEVTATSSNPVESVPQSYDVAQQPRIATVVIQVTSKSILNAGDYLTKLDRVTGYIYARADTVNWNLQKKRYTSGFTLSIGTDALLNRFVDGKFVGAAEEPEPEPEETTTDDTTTDDTTTDDTTTDDTTTDDADSTED